MEHSGKVWLVGAGPGDPGLMTLKGARVLAQADTVVYDRLLSPAILENIPAGARRIDVGKRAGDHPVPQGEINRILLEEARAGRRVVRLKGGDPFVFGRGGEELELLQAENIPFEVVPGVTSAVAAAAYAGIPVTHRDFCSSFHVVTGHARAGGALHLDFEALARLGGTLVFLMAVSHAPQLAAGLLAAGMDPQTPCAVVENGTWPSQRSFPATLETLPRVLEENRVCSPAVLLVGRVCALAGKFNWFERLPLHGVRVLVTSPSAKQPELLSLLRALGADAAGFPCIRTEPLPAGRLPLEDADALAFTSAAGVDAFFSLLRAEGRDARALAGKKIFCVGPKTAAACGAHGILADFAPAVADGEHLGRALAARGEAGPGKRFLLLRAESASPELPALLRASGAQVTELPVYRTLPAAAGEIPDPAGFDWIAFTSASAVASFAQALGRTDLSGMRALCIGEKTAARARALGMTALVSKEASLPAMAQALAAEGRSDS